MRVTFDSNVWQMVVKPALVGTLNDGDNPFVAVNEAIRSRRIEGFISETVGTLEAIKKAGRSEYFPAIRPVVEVNTQIQGNQILLSVNVSPDHDQHPGLPPILQERLEAAFSLGIHLLRAARMNLPVPKQFLELTLYAEEDDIAVAAARDNRFGEVLETIERRGVGAAALNTCPAGDKNFARAIAEWADGDSVAAHVAYKNDLFCTADKGRSAGGKSILDTDHRRWLHEEYAIRFATIPELARLLIERK